MPSNIRRFTILTKKIINTATSKPDPYQFEYKNPRNKNIKIYEVSLEPDTTFRANGQIYADVSDWTLLDIAAGDFSEVTSIDSMIPEDGFEFPKDSKIRLACWNSTGNGIVTLMIAIGEDD